MKRHLLCIAALLLVFCLPARCLAKSKQPAKAMPPQTAAPHRAVQSDTTEKSSPPPTAAPAPTDNQTEQKSKTPGVKHKHISGIKYED